MGAGPGGRGAALLLACLSVAAGLGNNVIRYDGDVNIGVLVDLHARDCGSGSSLNLATVQQVLAAKWAVDVINNQSLPHELSIGLQIHDTCSSEELAQQHLYHIITAVQNSSNTPPTQPKLIGLIGMGDPQSLLTASAALSAFHVPVVAVSPSFYSSLGGLPTHPNILTTAPELAGQARSLANIGSEVGAAKIALITSSHATVASFLSEATTLGVRVQEILEVAPRQHNIGPAVEGFLRSIRRPRPVVAMVLEAADVEAVAEHLKTVQLPSSPVWLLGSLGLELRRLKSWRQVFNEGAFVEPHMPELREFKNFFLHALKSSDFLLSSAVEDYMADSTGCQAGPGARPRQRQPANGKGVSCSSVSVKEMELRFQQEPQVSFVVKAVSALTAAFRLVQLDSCGQSVEVGCLRSVSPDLHNGILDNLHKLSFTSMSGPSQEVPGTRHHFTEGGRLVASKQIVYRVDTAGLDPIGWYSAEEGLTVQEDWVQLTRRRANLSSPGETPRTAPLVNSNSDRSGHSRSIEELEASEAELEAADTDKEMAVLASFSYESFIGRTWALVVISIALFGVCVSLWMMVYVFLKMCDGTLTGNQSMGVLLLLGVIVTFASTVPWLLPPSEVICAVRHFLHPLAFCLCFGLLLLKVMQLRSLVSVGLGGTIPQINQFLSLFFMVMVQVVITTEWYVINMPLQVTTTQLYPECDVAKETFLLLHVYPCLLLALTFLYGMSVFRIKRNYNEGRWVTCAAVCIIPVLAAWAIVYYFAPVTLHDPTNAVCILIIGGVLLTTIFFPKMHTISQQSKYRRLKMHGPGSESTVYTTYTDYAGAGPGAGYYGGGYYGPPYPPPPHPHHVPRYTRSHSKYRHQPQYRMGLGPYMSRFNGLNYLSHPYLASNTTSYTDWSREHTPGQYYGQYTHHDHSHTRDRERQQCSRRYSGHQHHHDRTMTTTASSSRKSASKTPDTTLASSSKHSSKRDSSEMMYTASPHKKSSLKTSAHQPLLLNPNGLPTNHTQSHYDESSRVYHITP